MSDSIISVSNLGKRYRIKHNADRQRYTALRDVIAEKFKGLFQNRKSEIGNRKLKGSAGVSPASFGVSPKETIKPPGGTPAEGNRASGSETTARRDGRAPQTSPLHPDRGEGQGEVFDASSNPKSPIGNRKSTEDFWALKDVSFEVRRGEVVGIGHNEKLTPAIKTERIWPCLWK